MTETFTAAQVRELTAVIREFRVPGDRDCEDTALAMLDAFAGRLEQDAKNDAPFFEWKLAEMTSQAVKEWLNAHAIFSSSHPWMWLDAFATRLEQEEAGAFASILAPAYELGRAQGRLDALRAVTAHPGPVTYCPACKSFTGQHEPTCSWLRAKSITQSAAGQ